MRAFVSLLWRRLLSSPRSVSSFSKARSPAISILARAIVGSSDMMPPGLLIDCQMGLPSPLPRLSAMGPIFHFSEFCKKIGGAQLIRVIVTHEYTFRHRIRPAVSLRNGMDRPARLGDLKPDPTLSLENIRSSQTRQPGAPIAAFLRPLQNVALPIGIKAYWNTAACRRMAPLTRTQPSLLATAMSRGRPSSLSLYVLRKPNARFRPPRSRNARLTTSPCLLAASGDSWGVLHCLRNERRVDLEREGGGRGFIPASSRPEAILHRTASAHPT